MFIKQVSIKNFRSIQYQVLDAKSLNILVGNNDIGKSNFLNALNLFFFYDEDLTIGRAAA